MPEPAAVGGLRVSAPGKLMLCGEYVVLEGAEAVVAAVGRRVYLSLGEPSAKVAATLPPEVAAARKEAERRWGAVAGDLALDVSQTRTGDQKLGVGSSAAGAAAAAGLVRAAAGGDLGDVQVRREVRDAALAGHHAVAPRGSGADVAAATMGGFVRYRRGPEGVTCEPTAWPEGLQVRVVWTGHQVRTSDMLDCVEALRRKAPAVHAGAMAELARAAEAFSAALAALDVAAIISATSGYHDAMARLGQLSGAPIVNSTLDRIAALAHESGGAAKPSGAGGGDVALALFADGSRAAIFEDRCREAGVDVISMDLGVTGVRVEA